MSDPVHPGRLLNRMIIAGCVMSVVMTIAAVAVVWRLVLIYGLNIEIILLGGVLVCLGVCVFILLWAARALVDLARINAYRADRDQELTELLADVRAGMNLRLGSAMSPSNTGSSTQLPSSVFKSSLMPFPQAEDDAALTALRPALQADGSKSVPSSASQRGKLPR